MSVAGNGEPAPTVRIERSGAVATITLARPAKRNAIDEQLMGSLLDALTDLRASRELAVVVLASEGPVFSAGIDFNSGLAMDDPDAKPFDGLWGTQIQHRLISTVYGLPQVTIAAIQGNAVGGGGLGLAMACDLRYAVESARFWMVPTALHEVQDFGLSWLLQRCAGDSRTLEWILTGEAIDADTAERHGLVQGLATDATALHELVRSRVTAITSTTPDVIRLQKFALRHGRTVGLEHQLDVEAMASALCFRTEEFAAAMAAARRRLRKA